MLAMSVPFGERLYYTNFESKKALVKKEEETVAASEDDTVGVFHENDPKAKSDTETAGKTEKEPVASGPELPPKKPRLIVIAAVVLLCFGISVFGYFNCWFGHIWIEASCTAARSCTRCGKEIGMPLGHDWIAASCTEAKNCSVCHVMEGAPLGHNWIDATCQQVKTCEICGVTEGSFADHKWNTPPCFSEAECILCGLKMEKTQHNWENTSHATTSCRYCEVKRYLIQPSAFSNLRINRENILEINFVCMDMQNVPNSAQDISFARNRSILVWEENGVLTVASDGIIAAYEIASSLFADFAKVRSIQFNCCFDTSNVKNMDYMFVGCASLTQLDLSNFDTSKVTNMCGMFVGCASLTQLDLSNFDTSNVTDMSSMFSFCISLTHLDLSNFDTSNVTDMSSMFGYCFSLTHLDLSNFDTSNVTDMSSMFSFCSSLTHLDLSGFDTSNVMNMSYMFSDCIRLAHLDLSNFIASTITEIDYMFSYCHSLISNSLICSDSKIRAEYNRVH